MANIIRVGGGAGGGLDITVVGGTTQPASPKDNTIWVNTNVSIGNVTLAPNAPASPATGDVWVNTTNKYNSNGTNASTNLIRVNDNPYLEINVLNISQWDGSAWVTRENSAIYANGAWTSMACWIYNYGTLGEFTLKSGGGKSNLVNGNVDSYPIGITYATDYFQINPAYDDDSTRRNLTLPTTAVSADKYNLIRVVLQKMNSTATTQIGYCRDSNPSTYQNSFGFTKVVVPSNVTTVQTIEADISAISGDIYPTIYTAGLYVKVYLWCLTA